MLNRLKDVFESFQKHEVRYIVIGGIAAVLYGVPRATFDLDILIEATPNNAQRLLTALLEAKLGTALLTTAKELLSHEIKNLQDQARIDVQTATPGITFKEAWQRKEELTYQRQKFWVVSKQDLISSKLAAGREIELEDVRLLTLDKIE